MQHDSTRILFVADLPAELRKHFDEQLAAIDGVTWSYPPDFEDSTITELAKDAEIIVGWRCPPGLLEAASNLRLWIFPGVGVQRLIEPFSAINETRKVILTNCHGNTYATAQHAVSLLLAVMNKVVLHHNWMKDGLWRKGDDDAVSTPLRDRKIGLLGYGGVNSKVHSFLSGFDVEFAVLRRHWEKMGKRSSLRHIQRYNPDQLEYFLSYIDVLMVALPETTTTIGMIGEQEMKLLGPGGYIVNVGRGPVVEETALYNSLKDGVIAGAGIDVWYDYRPEADTEGRKYPFSYPFHELDNVVMSPHRAASPVFDPQRWNEVIEIVRRHVSDEPMINVVDLDEGY